MIKTADILLQEAGEPLTLREITRRFSVENSTTCLYEDMDAALQRFRSEGKVVVHALHKSDYRETMWADAGWPA